MQCVKPYLAHWLSESQSGVKVVSTVWPHFKYKKHPPIKIKMLPKQQLQLATPTLVISVFDYNVGTIKITQPVIRKSLSRSCIHISHASTMCKQHILPLALKYNLHLDMLSGYGKMHVIAECGQTTSSGSSQKSSLTKKDLEMNNVRSWQQFP